MDSDDSEEDVGVERLDFEVKNSIKAIQNNKDIDIKEKLNENIEKMDNIVEIIENPIKTIESPFEMIGKTIESKENPIEMHENNEIIENKEEFLEKPHNIIENNEIIKVKYEEFIEISKKPVIINEKPLVIKEIPSKSKEIINDKFICEIYDKNNEKSINNNLNYLQNDPFSMSKGKTTFGEHYSKESDLKYKQNQKIPRKKRCFICC